MALDSGATASCFHQGTDFRLLAQPVTVRGALPGQSSLAKGTTSLPCPALPSGHLRGLHSPDFRHNLVSVSQLQSQGVEVLFPARARQAHCRDPSKERVFWTFQQGQLGLYEARVASSSKLPLSARTGRSSLAPVTQPPPCPPPSQSGPGPQIPATGTTPTSACASAITGQHLSPLHPSVLLHQRLGHMGASSIKTLINKQAIVGLPTVYQAPPTPFQFECIPCIQSKTKAMPHPLIRSRSLGLHGQDPHRPCGSSPYRSEGAHVLAHHSG